MGQTRRVQAAMIDAHVGLRLRQLRQERGLSLAALAEMMGHTSGQAVSKYEQGSAFPAALMFRTAAALGVPMSAFFDGLDASAPGALVQAGEVVLAETLDDSTEARKIAALLRSAPRSLHRTILHVVKVMVARGDLGVGGGPHETESGGASSS